MSEDKVARFRAKVTFSVTFEQTWNSYDADSAWDAKKDIETAIENQLKAGLISHKTLNKYSNGRHNGIRFNVEYPTDCYTKPTESVQQERLRILGEEIEGELTIVDCSGYESET